VVVENAGFGARHAAPIARKVLDYYLLGKLPPPERRKDKVASGA
jgi:penicillin-binding protein 2